MTTSYLDHQPHRAALMNLEGRFDALCPEATSAHHAACKFSATVSTPDVAVLHLLRALCQYCESGRYKQIAWGGTGESDWRKSGQEVTFRFTQQADRKKFLDEAKRLLAGHWSLIKTNNNDPATPRR